MKNRFNVEVRQNKTAERGGAVNPHAFGTFVTHPAAAGSVPKASGDT